MITLTNNLEHHEYDKMMVSIEISSVEQCAVMSLKIGEQQVSLTGNELAMLNTVMSSYEKAVDAFERAKP